MSSYLSTYAGDPNVAVVTWVYGAPPERRLPRAA